MPPHMTKNKEEIFSLPKKIPFWFHYDSSSSKILPIPAHWHNRIELLYITHGNTKIQIDSNEIIAKRGDFIAIPPYAIHSMVSLDNLSKYHTLILEASWSKNFGFDADNLMFPVPINDENINNIMENIIYEYYTKNPYHNALVMKEIINLLIYLFENYKRERNSNISRKNLNVITDAFDYIEKNYSLPITVNDIARHVGMSVSHFGHVFKEATGIPPVHHIRNVRCNKAIEMLEKDIYTISEISTQCGFNDVSYFTKIFKKYTNHLPSHHNKSQS